MSTYISEGEAAYLKERKEQAREMDRLNALSNVAFNGPVHTYKGIEYKRRADGQYFCIGIEPFSGLEGAFNNTNVLHWVIDNLESQGKLPKLKA